MDIQPASPEAAGALTEIAVAAKSHWGYPQEWIRQWEGELTVTADYVSSHPTYTASIDDKLVGFHAFLLRSNEAWLDHLWVSPASMGRGVGRALFFHAEKVAREAGAHRIKIVSDPHAEGFYRSMGATLYDQERGMIDGIERFLPLFAKAL